MRFLLVLVAATAGLGLARAQTTLVVRSGNAAIGLPDPQVSFIAGPSPCPLRPSSFTPTDFSDSCSGTPASVIANHPAWIPGLSTDPLAE